MCSTTDKSDAYTSKHYLCSLIAEAAFPLGFKGLMCLQSSKQAFHAKKEKNHILLKHPSSGKKYKAAQEPVVKIMCTIYLCMISQ
jgi:hypothetical protein